MATYLASEEGRARRAGISDRWKVVALEVFLLIADIAVGCVPLFLDEIMNVFVFSLAFRWPYCQDMGRSSGNGYDCWLRTPGEGDGERLLVTFCYVSMLYNSGIALAQGQKPSPRGLSNDLEFLVVLGHSRRP